MWKCHDDISIVRAKSPTWPSLNNLDNLQGIVVFPGKEFSKENGFIYIRRGTIRDGWRLRTVSRIFVVTLQEVNGHLAWVTGTESVALEHSLKDPRRCAVTVLRPNGGADPITVVVAHPDGVVEKRTINVS